MACSKEEIFEMVDKSRTSTDALSDYDSSAGSTISSVWESSEPDISDSDAEGEATDFSGSCSPIEPFIHVDHSVDKDKDSTEKTNLHEQQEPSSAPTSHYNLRSGSKRKSSATDGPPAKKPCSPNVFQNGGRQTRGGRGRGGHDGNGGNSNGVRGGKRRRKQRHYST